MATEGDVVQSPCPRRVLWSALLRIFFLSSQVLNTFGEEDSTLSLVNLFVLCHPHSREVLGHVQVELPVDQFLPVNLLSCCLAQL